MNKSNPMRQIVFPLLAALIWGTAFVAQDMCADVIEPMTFNAVRSYVAVVVLLGGGVSKAGHFLLDAVRQEIPTKAMGIRRSLPEFALASLGNDAGILGAALLGA